MLRFAIDIVIMTEKLQDLQKPLSARDRTTEEDFSKEINRGKTKIMGCS